MKQAISLLLTAFRLSCLPLIVHPILGFGSLVSFSHAQVTSTTGVNGLNTQVTKVGNVYEITQGTRSGSNIYHSFGTFSVGSIETARFQTANLTPDITVGNILGRVTGGLPSNIFGAIDSAAYFPNASLFLMNPAGFLFGPNAAISAGGMVAFTTADYLRLAQVGTLNSGVFHADPTQVSILTSAPVTAFGFLGSNPGAIVVQGSRFSVSQGQGISLIGGDITIESEPVGPNSGQAAQLSAPSGSIHLASAKSPGEFLATTLDRAANVAGKSFGSLGDIQISNKSVLDVSGDGGGTVLIRGGRFLIDDSVISANTTGPAAGPLRTPIGAGVDIEVVQDAIIKNGSVIETNVGKDVLKGLGSGGVRVKAESIEILGVFDSDAEVIAPTTIQSSVAKDSMGGPSGNIELEARSILLKDFGSLETLTEGIGDAGNILLKANNNIDMVFGSVFSGSINATGNAGNIELLSTNGNILASSTIILSQATATDGNAGSIAVKAPRGDILLGDASEVSNLTFRGGTLQGIQIESNNLTLSDNSIIAGNNFSTVTPGNISISLPGHLSLSGDSHIETVARGSARAADLTITANNISLTDASFLSTESRSSGNGGQLSIVTETLQLTSGGQIRSPSTIGIDPVRGTPVVPSGAGGTVNIHALGNSTSTVMIDGAGSGIFTNTVGTGTAGNTYIAAQTLTVQNGGTISAATSGISSSATGGAITVNANQVNLMNGGLITAASTGMGAGGSIVINSTNSLSSNAGVISTTASQATGGSIAITASQMVNLTNGATISASSTGPGNAGNIFINAGQQLNMQKGSITTEAAQAAGGNIDIRAVDIVNLQGSAVSTSVLGGTGSGGNITIDPNTVLLQNSQILANAVQGNGGNISITTNLLLPDATSLIKASSEFGQNGTIMIQSPISPASGKIIPLSQRPLTAATLLSQRCAVFAASGEMSSFTVAGRDRLPIEPGTWLASPTMFNPITPSFLTLEYSGHDDSIGDSPILALRQIAPAGFLSQAFAPDPSVECG